MTNQVVVTAIGMLTPVGFGFEQSCASIRAGVCRFTAHPNYWSIPANDLEQASKPEDEDDGLIIVSAVPNLDLDIPGSERIVQMSLLALQDMIIRYELDNKDLSSSVLLVALPEPDEVTNGWRLGDTLANQIKDRGKLPGWSQSHVCEAGSVSVVKQINKAQELLINRQADSCILVAVDSYIDSDRLWKLDSSWRLKSERNVDGFVPGEAAVVMLLELQQTKSQKKRSEMLVVGSTGFGNEPNSIKSENWSTGKGLTTAIHHALGVKSRPVGPVGNWIVSDFNGESYKAQEWGVVQTRMTNNLSPNKLLQHPADAVGDTGAATGGLLVACVAHAFYRNYAPDPIALAIIGSDRKERGVMVLQKPGNR